MDLVGISGKIFHGDTWSLMDVVEMGGGLSSTCLSTAAYG
jgi:hypothetical protein